MRRWKVAYRAGRAWSYRSPPWRLNSGVAHSEQVVVSRVRVVFQWFSLFFFDEVFKSMKAAKICNKFIPSLKPPWTRCRWGINVFESPEECSVKGSDVLGSLVRGFGLSVWRMEWPMHWEEDKLLDIFVMGIHFIHGNTLNNEKLFCLCSALFLELWTFWKLSHRLFDRPVTSRAPPWARLLGLHARPLWRQEGCFLGEGVWEVMWKSGSLYI